MANNNYWFLVPAAGIGARMGAAKPKQYLPLAGASLLEITLKRLHQCLPEASLMLALHPEDTYWPQVAANLAAELPQLKVHTCIGGATRAQSVLAGLQAMQPLLKSPELSWVLVHDAARPCITSTDIQRLTNAAQQHEVGAILATPVADTLKQEQAGAIAATLPREQVWQALTPQMFKFPTLLNALLEVLAQPETAAFITDEASALEAKGFQPLLVAGRRDNLKVTHPEDLPLAELILQAQASIFLNQYSF